MKQTKVYVFWPSSSWLRILFQLLSILVYSNASFNNYNTRITFENGLYNNIVVALDPKLDRNSCEDLVKNFMVIITSTNNYLSQTISAEFGLIKFVIPFEWGKNDLEKYCGELSLVVSEAKLYETYDLADIKITSTHPIASSKPWTKQYKGCQHEAEAIYIPANFLTTTDFDSDSKGRQLLHEWLKFRYGVFEENGYYDDPLYSPCYLKNKNLYFSNCNNNNGIIAPIAENITGQISDEQCKYIIQQHSEWLKTQLGSVNPSVMYNPHLRNAFHICTSETHNGLNPTKQNLLCERKSVYDIIISHSDFSNKFETKPLFPRTLPRIEYVQQIKNMILPGFAIIIEDTNSIRDYGKLKHIKQGIAQLVNMATDNTKFFVYRHDGSIVGFRSFAASSIDSRISILNYIPDLDTAPISSRKQRVGSVNNNSRTLIDVLTDVTRNLDIDTITRWEIVMFADSLPSQIDEAITLMKTKDYPLSIFTFDTSSQWLKFNGIVNTRSIINLPYCYDNNNRICSGKTSAIISDYLLELVTKSIVSEHTQNSVSTRRFFHKIAETEVDGSNPTSFTVLNVAGSTNFQLTIPVYDDLTQVLITPSGASENCNTPELLGYKGVISVNCPYTPGTWEVRISGNTEGRKHIIQGFVETGDTNHDLLITTSFGPKLQNEIRPSININFPIYISVMSKNDEPVAFANVFLDLFYQTISSQNNRFIEALKQIQLFDDGEEPDITRNDGIYSGFITNFAAEASYHTGIITISTSSVETKLVKGFQNEAALLDPLMNSKCCGSSLKFSESEATLTGLSNYLIVIPSFKTGEPFDASDNLIPPSKIYSPIIVNEDIEEEGFITLTFLAPGADYKENIVSHYNTCCTTSESGNVDSDSCCSTINTNECNPVAYNREQNCKLSLLTMYYDFFNGERPENETEITLYCGIKGIDDSNNPGPISSFLFEVVMNFNEMERIEARLNSDECNSVFDGCLPIEVFWVLIGCIGALMLILLMVVLCWFCSTRKSKEEKPKTLSTPTTTQQEKVFTQELHQFQEPLPLHNVYINEAFIQDSNGQLRLVASDGHLFESVSGNSGSLDHASFRRKSNSNSDMTFQNQLAYNNNNNNNKKYVSWQNDVNDGGIRRDTQVFFSRADEEDRNSISSPRQQQQYTDYNVHPPPSRSSLNYKDVELEDSIPRTHRRQSRVGQYTNPKFPRLSKTSQIPTVSAQLQPNDNSTIVTPIYASVSRGGRKPNRNSSPSTTSPNPYQVPSVARESRSYSPVATPTITSRPVSLTLPPKMVTKQKPSGLEKTLSTERISVTSQPTRPVMNKEQNSVPPIPPVRLDHFPSSESETYSDMSHIISSAYKMDNTRPSPTKSPSTTTTIQYPQGLPNGNKSTERQIPRPNQQPSIAKTPPSFIEDRKTRDSIGRPKFQPPPPPRRLSYSTDNHNNGIHQRSFIPNDNRNNSTEEYYDDDSDEWDNYDDVIFAPVGSSHA